MDSPIPPALVIGGQPADIGWQALGPAIGCMTLALISVIARWYTREFLTRFVGLDDYLVTFCMILSVASTAIIAVQHNLGFGKFEPQKNPSTVATVSMLVIAINVIYQVQVNLTKISIVVQYLRIFVGTSFWFRRICQLVLAILVVIPFWGVFGSVFMCVPIRKSWTVDVPGKCMNPQIYWFTTSSLNVVFDFVVWSLPMPLVSRLHLPRRQKLGLMLVFILGGVVCIVGILRVVLVHVAAYIWDDVTRAGVFALTWSVIEGNVGIICACLIALKPLITKLFPNFLESNKIPEHSMRIRKVSLWHPVMFGKNTTTSDSSTCVDSRATSSTLQQNDSRNAIKKSRLLSRDSVMQETEEQRSHRAREQRLEYWRHSYDERVDIHHVWSE